MKISYKIWCFQIKEIRMGLENFSLGKKVRTLCNIKLPNEEKSDIRTYQNAHICYERETCEKTPSEDFQVSRPRNLLAYYVLDD